MSFNVQNIVEDINKLLWGRPFLILFIFTGLYFTFKLGFPQLKIILSLFKLRKNKGKDNKKSITPYKSLMTILAGTLGTGNITGVASCIIIGGVGSIFWLLVSGFIAIVISYCENYLVLKHRKHTKSRGYFGGAMYVLDEVLGKRGLAILFSMFAILSTIGMGAMIQANSLTSTININFNIKREIIAIIISVISLYIVFGGKYRIAKVSSILVPVCSALYILLCVAVIIINKDNLTNGISYIIQNAFGIKQVIGGITGMTLIRIISAGFSRGMFSNEAGMGSAPIFSSTVEDENIELQAKISATSVFIDTILLCTLTGITIVSANTYYIQDVNELVSSVFSTVKYGKTILSICMAVFVIATIPCWEYYGEESSYYIFKNNSCIFLFKIAYVIFIYIGSMSKSDIVWNISSIFNLLMSLPNIYMIYKLEDKIRIN